MNQLYRPLGVLKEIIESIGLSLSYAYDDLVFVEGNPFMIRFDDDIPGHFFVHMNKECNPTDVIDLQNRIKNAATLRECTISISDRYYLEENAEKEEIEVVFVK